MSALQPAAAAGSATGSPRHSMIEQWGPGPERPIVAPGIVHVWRAGLDGPPCRGQILTSSELARAERFRFELDRRRWTRARTILRSLLGTYLGLHPRAVEIAPGDHGKPTWPHKGSSQSATPRACNSTSHTRTTSRSTHSRSTTPSGSISRSPAGRSMQQRSPGDLGRARGGTVRAFRGVKQQRELLRAWVRTEAALKCLGTGLSAGLQGGDADPHPLWLVDLDVGSRAAAALAVAEAPARVRLWEWS